MISLPQIAPLGAVGQLKMCGTCYRYRQNWLAFQDTPSPQAIDLLPHVIIQT